MVDLNESLSFIFLYYYMDPIFTRSNVKLYELHEKNIRIYEYTKRKLENKL